MGSAGAPSRPHLPDGRSLRASPWLSMQVAAPKRSCWGGRGGQERSCAGERPHGSPWLGGCSAGPLPLEGWDPLGPPRVPQAGLRAPEVRGALLSPSQQKGRLSTGAGKQRLFVPRPFVRPPPVPSPPGFCLFPHSSPQRPLLPSLWGEMSSEFQHPLGQNPGAARAWALLHEPSCQRGRIWPRGAGGLEESPLQTWAADVGCSARCGDVPGVPAPPGLAVGLQTPPQLSEVSRLCHPSSPAPPWAHPTSDTHGCRRPPCSPGSPPSTSRQWLRVPAQWGLGDREGSLLVPSAAPGVRVPPVDLSGGSSFPSPQRGGRGLSRRHSLVRHPLLCAWLGTEVTGRA